jgi:hypothetical protein
VICNDCVTTRISNNIYCNIPKLRLKCDFLLIKWKWINIQRYKKTLGERENLWTFSVDSWCEDAFTVWSTTTLTSLMWNCVRRCRLDDSTPRFEILLLWVIKKRASDTFFETCIFIVKTGKKQEFVSLIWLSSQLFWILLRELLYERMSEGW